MLLLLVKNIGRRLLKKIQRCKNHRRRLQQGAEKSGKFSDAPQVWPNLTLPRLAKERRRQANDERRIFSFTKICEPRSE